MHRRRPAPYPFVLALAACASACASPTLPLPPPLAPSVSAGSDADHVTLTAACNPSERDLVIQVINEGGGAQAVPPGKAVGGAIADSCGAWQTEMFAHRGDSLVVTYVLDQAISQPTVVDIR